jgi:hypothetical protein
MERIRGPLDTSERGPNVSATAETNAWPGGCSPAPRSSHRRGWGFGPVGEAELNISFRVYVVVLAIMLALVVVAGAGVAARSFEHLDLRTMVTWHHVCIA